MSDVSLKLDENNELVFDVQITGDEPISQAPIIRMVCENKGVSYVFSGIHTGNNNVEVFVPPMAGKLTEGDYKAKLEVILEGKYFVPLEMNINFQMSRSVVAEIAQRPTKKEPESTIKASLVKTTKSNIYNNNKKTFGNSLKSQYKKGIL